MKCGISGKIIRNPVLLSSGNSYEKNLVEKHLLEKGYKDPLTTVNVLRTVVINRNLKHAIDEFLEKLVINYNSYRNPWAYHYNPGENYKTISFD